MALRCSYAGAGLCLSWEFGRKVRGMIEPSCLNPFPSWAEKLQTTAVAMGPDWDPADVKVFGSPFLRFPLRVYTACHRFPPLGLSHPETQPERTCVLYSPGPCHHLAFCVRSTDTASARGAGGGQRCHSYRAEALGSLTLSTGLLLLTAGICSGLYLLPSAGR